MTYTVTYRRNSVTVGARYPAMAAVIGMRQMGYPVTCVIDRKSPDKHLMQQEDGGNRWVSVRPEVSTASETIDTPRQNVVE